MTLDESPVRVSAEAFLQSYAVLQERLGKDIVGDPVLEIVLHLLTAQRDDRLVTKSMLQDRLTISPLTADRYLDLLEARGIVIQFDEGRKDGHATIALTEKVRVLLGLAFLES